MGYAKKKTQQTKNELHNRFVYSKWRPICRKKVNNYAWPHEFQILARFVQSKTCTCLRFFLLLFGGEMIKCRETFYLAAPKGKALVAVFEGCEIDNSRLIHSKRHQIHWNMNSCMCTTLDVCLACYQNEQVTFNLCLAFDTEKKLPMIN